MFGDLMEEFDTIALAPEARLHTSWLYALTKKINTAPSLYLKAGAIHGCVLCQEDRPLVYMEDVGRHNAVDKIAGYMLLNGIARGQELLHHRPAHLGDGDQDGQDAHPDPDVALGVHGVGVELARKANLTLIGRARGRRFVALAGTERIVFDAEPARVEEEDKQARAQGQPG